MVYLRVTKQAGQTVLQVAASHGHSRIAELLLDHGADIEANRNVGWACYTAQ